MTHPRQPIANSKKQKQRRQFLRSLLVSIGVVGVALLGVLPGVKNWLVRLRPPGALAEDQFLAACIKCGQCVQVCPVAAVKLADLDAGINIGTPYIDARAQACDFSCDGLQCVLACPTGALTHTINYPHQTAMATAKVVSPDRCLAALGKGFKGPARGAQFSGKLRYDEVDRWNPILVSDHPYALELCDLCLRQCPIEIRRSQCQTGKPPSGDKYQCPPKPAISFAKINTALDDSRMLPIIHEGCVGCGVCEMICPVEPAAIVMEIEAPAMREKTS